MNVPAVGTLSRPPLILSPPLVPLCACSMLCLQALADHLSPLSTRNVYDLSLLNPGSQRPFLTCFLKVCGFWQTSNSR